MIFHFLSGSCIFIRTGNTQFFRVLDISEVFFFDALSFFMLGVKSRGKYCQGLFSSHSENEKLRSENFNICILFTPAEAQSEVLMLKMLKNKIKSLRTVEPSVDFVP